MVLPPALNAEPGEPSVETAAEVVDGIRARRARLRALRHAILNERARSLSIAPDELVRSFVLPRWVGESATEAPGGSSISDPDASRDARAANYVAGLLNLDGFTCRPSLRNSPAVGPVDLGLNPNAAAFGATVVALLATAVGLYSQWLYGLIFAVAGGAAVWVARNLMPELDRWAPAFIPRGRLLGVVVALIFVGVAGVAVILPIHDQRNSDANAQAAAYNVATAEHLVAEATAYAAAGDTSGATTLLAQATQIDPTVPGGEAAQVQILSAVVRSAVASALAQPRSHK